MLPAVFLLVTFSFSAADSVRYVSDSSLGGCPGHPCLTLGQYVNESSRYFTNGSRFLFLPGNHSLDTMLNITAVSQLTLGGTADIPLPVVICTDEITVENVANLVIEKLNFIVHFSLVKEDPSVFTFVDSTDISIVNSTFRRKGINSKGRAISSIDSDLSLSNTLIENNAGHDGGAILAVSDTTLSLTGVTFARNEANGSGGAIYADNSTITVTNSDFYLNSAVGGGGAVYCSGSEVLITGGNTITANSATGEMSMGGATQTHDSTKLSASNYATFSNNTAAYGGAISLVDTYAEFKAGNYTFKGNTAGSVGGALHVRLPPPPLWMTDVEVTSLVADEGNFTFVGNTAGAGSGHSSEVCGVLCLYYTKKRLAKNSMSLITLLNNSGTSGGAIFIQGTDGFTLKDIRAEDNSGGVLGLLSAKAVVTGTNVFSSNSNRQNGAVTIANGSNVCFDGSNMMRDNRADQGAVMVMNSTVAFHGNTSMVENFGESGGGAITLRHSAVQFVGNNIFQGNVALSRGGGAYFLDSNITFQGNITLFKDNTAGFGGAMYLVRGKIEFGRAVDFRKYSDTLFTNNTAAVFGGGLAVSGTSIAFIDTITMSFNSAKHGGAMHLTLGASLTLALGITLATTGNTASEYGGAIYHEDTVTILQCQNVTDIIQTNENLALTLQSSFLQLTPTPENTLPLIFSCPRMLSSNDSAGKDGHFLYGGLLDRSRLPGVPNVVPFFFFTSYCSIDVAHEWSEKNDVTSEPYQLSSCGDHGTDTRTGISVYRGQTFRVWIVALGQGKSTVPTTVTASIGPNARLKLNQSTQYSQRNCSEMTFNLYSTEKYEHLTLFPEGPCRTQGDASLVVNVTFLPCPNAFNQSKEECVCEERLAQYNATCAIEDGISILRYKGVNFWMNATYSENGSYRGLILYHSCPAEYCTAETVNITLEHPDIQCAFNRSGILCGQCSGNYSLLLGGAKCGACSNIYLLLLLPFAAAGIALVFFLSVLKLTVANGSINSLILYANVVQVNKNIFFPSNSINVLTVFVAWMNLDLGFETCLFNGLDVYVQTWLQFVFSVYVWVLISIIILTSRYSITVSKLVGSNPVAVLATLLLMSYNKILKVIIDVYSSVILDYPNKKQVTVWLKDGNLHYFHSKHLLLSIFTLFVLVLVFLPYTVFLLLGHRLYRLPYKRYYHWLIMRILPILDSYYAPYKTKTRYWTGFLLLVRCALYIVFAFNSLGGSKYSLLAIIVAFSAVGSITWLTKGIYRHFYVDVIEVSVYMNLIMLAAAPATLSGAAKQIMVYVLVGVVFATMAGLVLYHLHLRCFAKSALWLRIKSKIAHRQQPLPEPITPTPNVPDDTGPVSKTVINLREPLLEF